MDDRRAEREQRVTPLELFFDLVFVFAVTQVTSFLSHSPTWGGLLRGLLLLGALWWAWGVCLADEYPRPRGRGRSARGSRRDRGDARGIPRSAGRLRP